MSVYISQNGHVSSNRAEARQHGSIRTFDTPSTKADWIAFINEHYGARNVEAPAPEPTAPPIPAPAPAIVQNGQHNIDVEEEIGRASFDDACRLHEHAVNRINEHIRAARRGETL